MDKHMRRCFVRTAALGAVLGAVLFCPTVHATSEVKDGSGARGTRWQQSVVHLTMDSSLEEVDQAAIEAMVDAVTAWQKVKAELPTLVVTRGKAGELGYHSKGRNTNSVVYMPDGLAKANGALAITITTFDLEKGEILDADIVLNGEHQFQMMAAPSDEATAYDLQNVLTHEMGHFLGLGEEYENDQSTMFAYSKPGEIDKRQLAKIDAQTIRGLYLDNYDASVPANCAASITGREAARSWGWSVLGLVLSLCVYQARRRAFKTAAVSAASACAVLAGLWSVSKPPVQATVAALSSEWEAGIIVTTAQLRPQDCPDCSPVSVQVLGGRVGHIEQRIGMLRPLSVGDRIDSKFWQKGGEAASHRHQLLQDSAQQGKRIR